MDHGNVVLGFFLPAHQDAPKSVRPTMRSLDDPPPGSETAAPSDQNRFLATTPNVGSEPVLTGQTANLLIVISFIETQVLPSLRPRARLLHRNALKGFTSQLEVVHIRGCDSQAYRQTRRLDQDASLGAGLGSVRRVGPGFSPHPRGPWSSHRPCSATTSPDPVARGTPQDRFATTSQTPPPPATPGNAGVPSNSNRCQWHSGHSTGSRFAPRKEWHSSHPGRSAEAAPRQRDACSYAPATTAPQTTTAHPISTTAEPTSSRASMHPPSWASRPSDTIGRSGVIGIGSNCLIHRSSSS